MKFRTWKTKWRAIGCARGDLKPNSKNLKTISRRTKKASKRPKSL